jgi:acyl dehydratase
MTEQFFEDVSVGTELPPLAKVPTTVQLFRYSAVTWNAHRIHYEQAYAEHEGHPGVLVQAHLHGAFLLQTITTWMGPRARIVSFGWSNRGRAVPGDTLTCRGRVTAKRVEGGRQVVDLELEEKNQRGELCAPAKATVALPSREMAR